MSTSLKKEYLKMVPEFNGEPSVLPRFIEITEKLVNKFYNTADPSDFQNEFLMYGIMSRIKGPAAEIVHTSKIITWADLKIALLNIYSDGRDGYTLIEMAGLRQNPTENPFHYYNKIQTWCQVIKST